MPSRKSIEATQSIGINQFMQVETQGVQVNTMRKIIVIQLLMDLEKERKPFL